MFRPTRYTACAPHGQKIYAFRPKHLLIKNITTIFVYQLWYIIKNAGDMAMIQVTSREFRDSQASMFDLADKGEQIIIKRRGKTSYMLMPIADEDFILTPEVEARIEKSRKQYREGKCITCKTKEELQDFLNSL